MAFVAAWSPRLAAIYGGPAAVVAILITLRRPRLHVVDVLAGLTAIWAVVSTLVDEADPLITQLPAYLYASAFLVFLAVRHIVRSRAELIPVALAHVAGCAATAMALIVGARDTGSQRDALFDYNVRYGLDGININYTSYTLVTGAVLTVVLLRVGPRSRVVRSALFGTLAVSVYGVLLTGSKGATIGLIAGALYLVLARFGPRLTWAVARVGVPALILLIPFKAATTFETTARWLDSLFGRETGDLSGRLEVWPIAVSAWMEQPVTGLGPGLFRVVNPLGVGPHNLLLTVGTDLGLIGVILYGSTIAVALACAAKQAKQVGSVLAGVFIVTLLPIWVTGHWEQSQGAWLVLALVSTVTLDATTRRAARHRLMADEGRVSARPHWSAAARG
ncbi:O-antigen ligase family protein [Micromonospora costi]|uniref:O-antigen ligase family protein n=1 Tax=Micromonospora costi TaxID=1530042 RepID=UPI001319FB67|nr:O-antigen ligase family protein [Micromonospora costi]